MTIGLKTSINDNINHTLKVSVTNSIVDCIFRSSDIHAIENIADTQIKVFESKLIILACYIRFKC